MSETQNNVMKGVQAVVDTLTPFSSDDRQKIISASLTLLGEGAAKAIATHATNQAEQDHNALAGLGKQANLWLKQNGITPEQLEQVFHFSESEVTVILQELPGKDPISKVQTAYVLCGLTSLLKSDVAKFDDKEARALCVKFACYDNTNHSKRLQSTFFTGSKKTGWELTAPGKKRGAEIIKAVVQSGDETN